MTQRRFKTFDHKIMAVFNAPVGLPSEGILTDKSCGIFKLHVVKCGAVYLIISFEPFFTQVCSYKIHTSCAFCLLFTASTVAQARPTDVIQFEIKCTLRYKHIINPRGNVYITPEFATLF